MKKILNNSFKRKGFALIATVAILALVVMISLAMVSLSATVSRSSANVDALEEAKANARLALTEAIAVLQKQTGLDTRITAPADVLENNPYMTATSAHVRQLVGAWRSWEGLNHDPISGRPIAPDYRSKTDNSSLNPRFLRWLVSDQSRGDIFDPSNPPLLTEDTGNSNPLLNTVALLAEGSVGTDPLDQVHLVPSLITHGSNITTGAKAWWVQGEQTKVQLQRTTEAIDATDVINHNLISPGPSGTSFGFNSLDEVGQAISHKSLDLLTSTSATDLSHSFHDLTTYSRGLMVNVANGGWKRDFSLFAEELSREIPEEFWPIAAGPTISNIPVRFSAFTLSPTTIHTATKEGTFTTGLNASPGSPRLYPWAADVTNHASVGTWAMLAHYATDYKNRLLSDGSTNVSSFRNNMDGRHQLWSTRSRRMPVIAMIHQTISLSAIEGNAGSGTYDPVVVISPVITMWNPYGVILDLSENMGELNVELTDSVFPTSLKFSIDGTEDPTVRDLGTLSSHNDTDGNYRIIIPMHSPTTWMPGEVRIFSGELAADTFATIEAGEVVRLAPGYRPGNGRAYKIPGHQNLSATTTFGLTKASVGGTIYDGPNINGIGFNFNYVYGAGATTNRNTANMGTLLSTIEILKENLGDWIISDDPIHGAPAPPPVEQLSILANDPQPILACANAYRFTQDIYKPTNPTMQLPVHKNLITNGIHNLRPPLGFKLHSVPAAEGRPDVDRYDGSSYTTLIFPVSDIADPNLPSGVDDELTGYIGNSFRTTEGGLTNFILYDVPDRPIRTIVDLQHAPWSEASILPPHTLNPVGNSTASPFVTSDEIRLAINGNFNITPSGYDHSFSTNHILMDDWFISTAAEDFNPWGSNANRTWQQVYTDFINGSHELPNSYYKKARSAMSATDFTADPSMHWQRIAAELEVEGMFNINSTSEKAWAMLLKGNFGPGLDGNKILSLDYQNRGSSLATTTNSASINPSDPLGKAFPRTTLTTAVDTSIPAEFTAITQPIRFTNNQIDVLAEEIVKEIKQRGPFLSLSEFFNRQLQTTNTDLAKAGVVESALAALSELPNNDTNNPFGSLKNTFTDQASTENPMGAPLTYPFPEAAEGNPAYGFPGWTRQADILGPISGNITARDDTFTIRAYGSSVDSNGNIKAEAWCEALVQRRAEYVDPIDSKYDWLADGTLDSNQNKIFGRRYHVLRFRWLNSNEI